MAPAIDLDDIKRRGRDTQTLAIILLVIGASAVAGDAVVAPAVQAWNGGTLPAVLTVLRDNMIDAAPLIILLSGLWSAQRVFGRVAAGEVFTGANASGLSDIGSAMGWCAFAEVVMVPTVKVWIARSGAFDFALEGWAIVLGALGGAVVLIGRMWALAVEIKTEADQIV